MGARRRRRLAAISECCKRERWLRGERRAPIVGTIAFFAQIRAVVVDHGFAAGACIGGHDWAIIELDRPVAFDENVAPICLPRPATRMSSILVAASYGRASGSFARRARACDRRQTPFAAFEESAPLIRTIPMRHDAKCDAPWSDFMPTRNDYVCTKSLKPHDPNSKRTCHVADCRWPAPR